MGAYVRLAAASPPQMVALEKRLSTRPTPLKWAQGYTLFNEIRDHGEGLDLMGYVPALAKQRLLIFSALRDEVVNYENHHLKLVNALGKAGATGVEEYTLDADHSFSGHRLELTKRVVGWMSENCR